MSNRPPRANGLRDMPTWLLTYWLVLIGLVGCMASIGGVMWVVSRRF